MQLLYYMQEPWLVLLNEMTLSLETGNAAVKAQESSSSTEEGLTNILYTHKLEYILYTLHVGVRTLHTQVVQLRNTYLSIKSNKSLLYRIGEMRWQQFV